jgi:hypothetical protein
MEARLCTGQDPPITGWVLFHVVWTSLNPGFLIWRSGGEFYPYIPGKKKTQWV